MRALVSFTHRESVAVVQKQPVCGDVAVDRRLVAGGALLVVVTLFQPKGHPRAAQVKG